jgi:hypothetical protein
MSDWKKRCESLSAELSELRTSADNTRGLISEAAQRAAAGDATAEKELAKLQGKLTEFRNAMDVKKLVLETANRSLVDEEQKEREQTRRTTRERQLAQLSKRTLQAALEVEAVAAALDLACATYLEAGTALGREDGAGFDHAHMSHPTKLRLALQGFLASTLKSVDFPFAKDNSTKRAGLLKPGKNKKAPFATRGNA